MACNSINSTLEIFTVAILCMLAAAILLKEKKDDGDKLLFVTVLLHTINTLGDLAAWRFAGKPDRFSAIMSVGGNYVTYLFSVFAYMCFMVVAFRKITEKRYVDGARRLLAVLISLCSVFLLLLTLTNHFTGALYSISADNIFTWGRWCTMFDNTVLIQLVLLSVLILIEKQKDRKEALVQTFLYLGIPIVAIITENWYTSLMLIYPAVAFSLHLVYVSSQREQEREMLEQKVMLAETRSALLASQIKPHFLYNVIGTIVALCGDGEAKEAGLMATDLAEYLRGRQFATSQVGTIPFEEELSYIETYLRLEKRRYGEKLNIKYDIQVKDGINVPMISVQPLVENAVKHGICKREVPGTVVIATRETPEDYIIEVRDDGVGFVPDARLIDDENPHIGIKNVEERVRIVSGGSLVIESVLEKGTIATITIPQEKLMREEAL